MTSTNQILDCACVIHGHVYDWIYVERLHSMLTRNFNVPIRLHVWTEKQRSVPPHMIKHGLEEWPGIQGHRKAWWYKMQMFNKESYSGTLLYFDLDVIIVKNLDWVLACSKDYFWGVRDFRYLWKPGFQGINSSMMYWDTTKFHNIWESFSGKDIATVTRQFAGDQDFLNAEIELGQRKFFDKDLIQSWRWQINDGGMDIPTRKYRIHNAGAMLTPQTNVVVFHGSPKPHQIEDQAILQYWV